MTARLVQKPVKGKASCLPIQEELNDNPYVKRAMRYGKGGTLDREITAEDICSIPYERRNKIGFNL